MWVKMCSKELGMTPLSSGLLRTPVRGEIGREEGRIEEGERGERGDGSIEKEGREK